MVLWGRSVLECQKVLWKVSRSHQGSIQVSARTNFSARLYQRLTKVAPRLTRCCWGYCLGLFMDVLRDRWIAMNKKGLQISCHTVHTSLPCLMLGVNNQTPKTLKEGANQPGTGYRSYPNITGWFQSFKHLLQTGWFFHTIPSFHGHMAPTIP